MLTLKCAYKSLVNVNEKTLRSVLQPTLANKGLINATTSKNTSKLYIISI